MVRWRVRVVVHTRYGSLDETATGAFGSNPPPVVDPHLYVNGKAEPMWRRVPQPKALPPWLTQDEFEYVLPLFIPFRLS